MLADLSDPNGRKIEYLRISVTDRCNLRCRYCMPEHGVPGKRHEDILRYEEIARIVEAIVPCGVIRLRLTGGEPLVRPQLPALIRMLSKIGGLQDIALTTNGQLLARYAQELRKAGLQRINVSLDTLRPERYRYITRGGELDHVLQGLAVCREVGLHPVKINVVIVRSMNDDEIADFARLTLREPYDVRFIEFMPMGDVSLWSPSAVVTEGEMREALRSVGTLQPAQTPATSRGGEAWQLAGARGTIAFISPFSKPFCGSCNRLRLTADGQLRPCLLSDQFIDVRAILRQGGADEDIREAFKRAVCAKPRGHRLKEGASCHPKTPMSSIGG